MTTPITTYDEARRWDTTVYRNDMAAVTNEDTIVDLVNEKRALTDRIIELEQIAPKAIRGPDGRTYVWHCPDHLVPVDSP